MRVGVTQGDKVWVVKVGVKLLHHSLPNGKFRGFNQLLITEPKSMEYRNITMV